MIGWKRGGSIFLHSMALAIGIAVVLAAASIFLVLVARIPANLPPSTFEIARALAGDPILHGGALRREAGAEAPDLEAGEIDPYVRAVRDAIARQAGVPAEAVVFRPLDQRNGVEDGYERAIVERAALYRDDPRFSPLVFGQFSVSLLANGSWTTVTTTGRPISGSWQWELARWIVVALLLMIPVAWLFSAQLARPIQALAEAAYRIGAGSFERVQVRGPAEVRTAAEALNEMQTRIEQSLKQRSFVVGAIAHDLRTPLARLAFLLANAPDDLRRNVESQIEQMEAMISRTLDFVRSEGVSPNLELVDLRLLIEGVVDDFSDGGADVRLEASEAALVRGDAVLLSRLFTNVVSNAVKYGVRARVKLGVEEDRAVVEVADDGPGIASADMAHVFEPFYRAERSRGVATGGIGLGLAIVKSLAEAHRGSVRLTTRPGGGGLVARIELPLASDAP